MFSRIMIRFMLKFVFLFVFIFLFLFVFMFMFVSMFMLSSLPSSSSISFHVHAQGHGHSCLRAVYLECHHIPPMVYFNHLNMCSLQWCDWNSIRINISICNLHWREITIDRFYRIDTRCTSSS